MTPPGNDLPRRPVLRQRYPLGLRRPDKSRPVIRLPLTGAVPAHPPVVDHLSRVPVWNGGTNLAYGTCGPVYVANSIIDTYQYLTGERITVSDAAIFDLYRRSGNPDFDPATGAGDNGVDMTVMLAEVVRGGLEITRQDGTTETVRALCFAQAPVPPYDNLHATTSIFGQVGLALDLDDAQAAQTGERLWDYVQGSPPWGGHATCGGKYTSATAPHTADISLVTWQEVVGTTVAFLDHQLWGAYVIVWPLLWDHPAFAEGVDRAALAAAFEAVTLRPFPLPVPPPPPPVPATDADDVTLWSSAGPWARARHWCASTRRAASSLITWARAKGLTK